MANAGSTVDALLGIIPVAATVAVAGSAFRAFDLDKRIKKSKNKRLRSGFFN